MANQPDRPSRAERSQRVVSLGGLKARLVFPLFRRLYMKAVLEGYEKLRQELNEADAKERSEAGSAAEAAVGGTT